MPAVTDKFTQRTKAFYEEIQNELTAGQKGVDDFLFPTLDVDPDSANFAIDSLIVNPHGVAFRRRGEQAAVRAYEPGSGMVYPVAIASEATPIDETLRDAIIAGGEIQEAFASRNARLLTQILRQLTVAFNSTRWKKAVDVIRTGIWSPTGLRGEDIGLEIDFGRSATLDRTYNFTDADASFDTALKELYDAYRAQSGSLGNLCLLAGSDWIRELERDADVLQKIQANASNVLVRLNMTPQLWQNTYGLRFIGEYRAPGMSASVIILSYEPDAGFVPYKGATVQDYLPADEALLFSMSSTRYKVLRGVDVLDDAGNVVRAVGDIVFDQFSEPNPVATWIRGSTRHVFVPGNVNHTARSTGTFSET